MQVLALGFTDIKELLPMRECVPLMAAALKSLAEGRSSQPVRTVFRPPEAAGLMSLMPAFRADDFSVFGLKAICVFPGNLAKGKDAHQGAVLLFSAETGEPLAVENASAITGIRTAAVSAVATDILARKDAGVLAIIGAGIQGRAHLEAIPLVRPLREVRVADKDADRAKRFAAETGPAFPFRIRATDDVAGAVSGADIIVTVTDSSEPVLRREWIAPGAHINAVGACAPFAREIDASTMAASRLFVDKRESALHESGDILLAVRDGAFTCEHVRAEIGEVLTGAKPGRTSGEEITMYESLGLAVEDLAAAAYVYEKARSTGRGTWIDF
jgi:ornithine cyclodeaminase/alanine dehydrogenase-like protein (mu-crystallin family)